MAREGAGLFAAFRVLGRFSGHVPHVLRYHGRHREFYLAVAVGRSVHTYNVKKLGIVAVSNTLPQDITCLAADRMLIFASYDNILHAFARNKEVVHTYEGHKAKIHLLQPFGDHVISVDVDNVLIVWNIQSEEEYLQIDFDKATFAVSALLHPSTYLNKILLGSEQGTLQLWNIRSNKLLYSFPGWGLAVTTLEQAPAVDVVAVGLVSGHIIVHNIKFDETLMKFQQDWGPITAISFRTDGHPVMAAGSPVGHIALWDLEEKKLMCQMQDAHSTAIAGMTFVPGEPLLVTNGADNALRIWIFDGPGGTGRVLRSRMGHSAPPTKIRYHGQNGEQILSAGQDGTLQSFSTVHEKFNKSLGRGSINKKKSKKKGLKLDTMALPPIIAFASEVAHQSDWDGIVACHQGYITCTTWNYQKTSMGAHKLRPEEFSKYKPIDIYATAVDITSCGNFAVIGMSTGQVDVYNMQSGIHRGHYGKETAHEGAIRGVAVDGLNQLVITAGSEGLIKFWKFKVKDLVYSAELSSPPSGILLHRDSGILGIAFDDFTISVLDIETRKIVRTFSGHHGRINDMTFSPDGRWLITSSMDCSIKTWDLPSGCLIDCFLVDSAAVSLTMSPTGDFLASAHVDDLGIYLWSNRSLYSLVSLRPLPADYEPSLVTLPSTCPMQDVDVSGDEEPCDEMIEYVSPEQLGEQLVTLSLLPESRWKNLLNLDIIKKKNKPREPPKVPKSAPFFIPTLPGLIPRYIAPEEENDTQSKVVNLGILAQKSDFCIHLEEALSTNQYKAPLDLLKSLGPSNIEVELRGLAPEGGGSMEVMLSFLRMIGMMLNKKHNFELAQAYLALFLKLHLKILSSEPKLLEEISKLSMQLEETWVHLRALFNQNTFGIPGCFETGSWTLLPEFATGWIQMLHSECCSSLNLSTGKACFRFQCVPASSLRELPAIEFETLECRALKSPHNQGTAQNSCTLAVQCDSTGIEEVPDNWVEAVVPIFNRGEVQDGGTCWFIKLPSSRRIMEHMLHVPLESISSAQRERLGESQGQFLLAQGARLLG